MIGNKMLLFPVMFPIIAAMFFLFLKKEKQLRIYIFFSMILETISVILLCMTDSEPSQFLQIDKNIHIMFQID